MRGQLAHCFKGAKMKWNIWTFSVWGMEWVQLVHKMYLWKGSLLMTITCSLSTSYESKRKPHPQILSGEMHPKAELKMENPNMLKLFFINSLVDLLINLGSSSCMTHLQFLDNFILQFQNDFLTAILRRFSVAIPRVWINRDSKKYNLFLANKFQ